MLQQIVIGLCLVLVIEGMLPAIDPSRFRKMIALLSQIDDNNMRYIGIGSMAAGAILLALIN